MTRIYCCSLAPPQWLAQVCATSGWRWQNSLPGGFHPILQPGFWKGWGRTCPGWGAAGSSLRGRPQALGCPRFWGEWPEVQGRPGWSLCGLGSPCPVSLLGGRLGANGRNWPFISYCVPPVFSSVPGLSLAVCSYFTNVPCSATHSSQVTSPWLFPARGPC